MPEMPKFARSLTPFGLALTQLVIWFSGGNRLKNAVGIVAVMGFWNFCLAIPIWLINQGDGLGIMGALDVIGIVLIIFWILNLTFLSFAFFAVVVDLTTGRDDRVNELLR
jgi:uncharacterized membrane protein